MDNLVKGLPKNTTTDERLFKVINSVNSKEGNVCTASQVAVAKERGWRVLHWKNDQWVDYTGGSDYMKGDVNGDGQVNGTDLVALTNMILGKTNKTDAADVNGDGQVNGTDYVALVNIVLGRTNASRSGNRAGEATAKLSIESFDIKAGEEKELIIDLTNPQDEITLVQFDLKLPSGLSIKKAGGEYDFDIVGRTTWRKHSLDANDVEGGATRFLLASSSNATLSGTEGAIIQITLKADNTFSSGDINLENILLVTPSEKETKQPTYTYHVGESQPSTSEASLAAETFSIKAGEEKELVIDLLNPKNEITLVQFDLRLPSGLTLKQINGEYEIDIAGRTTWRKHSLDANATDGIIRFLLSSSSNATLSGTEGAIIKMTLKADNSFTNGTIKLENILLVTPDEKEIKPSAVEITTNGPLGDGTLTNPFNAIAANNEAAKLDRGETSTQSYYIKGKISQIRYYFSEQYGTASFYISDDGKAENQFYTYGTYYLENKPWINGNNQISIGDEVIIYGKLCNYNGTLEAADKQNYIYSHNGSTTDISIIKFDQLEAGGYYTLDGRRIDGKPSKKGIYIINGRKVIVK